MSIFTRRLIVVFIIIVGFSLRLYAASTIPLTHDEKVKISLLKEMGISGNRPTVLLGSAKTENPPLLLYLMKASCLLLGENKIAARLPSVIFGSLLLLILYLLVKNCLTLKAAMISLLLVTFSQFFIGYTRLANEDGLLLFFVVCILFFAERALHSQKRKFLILTGLFMGLGLLVKMTIIILLPVIVFYLFFYYENKNIFSIKDLLLFLLIIGIMISPHIYWNVRNDYVNYRFYMGEADLFSFSLIPTALFLGEIIVFGMRNFGDAIFYWIFSYEYPFLNWLMGLICLAGVYYFLRNKRNSFITLLLWIFCFVFVFFSFARARSGGGFYFHLDNFWWAIASVVPGFILASAMLAEFSDRYRVFRYILPAVVLYFIMHAVIFVNFPANCFIPRKSIKVKELFDAAANYLEQGNKGQARMIYDYIEKHYPEYAVVNKD